MKKKKVINLAEYRRKGVAPSLDEVARLAALRYFDPVILANNKEPIDLVSGKTFDGGSFRLALLLADAYPAAHLSSPLPQHRQHIVTRPHGVIIRLPRRAFLIRQLAIVAA